MAHLVLLFLFIGAVLLFYFLPAFIANRTGHPNAVGIFVLNLLLGWTMLGWIIALVWSLSKPQQVVVIQQPAIQQVRPPEL